jgi:sigma-B regulation protein RsbU (phosphoserine phosphatase)
LAPGETLLVYTDGVTEAMNEARDLFGEERLLEAMTNRASQTAEKLTESVVEKVEDFVREAERSDDITLLAIKRLAG